MKQYIDKSAVVAEIERLQGFFVNERDGFEKGYHHVLRLLKSFLDTLKTNPEPYFYCKYGGTIPLCSDCKRNHNNSPFKTEEITTWYAPSNGTKRCVDYIQQEQPEVDLEKEIDRWWCSQFTDYSMKRVPNHKFIPAPAYIDSNFKQSETGKTKIALELWMDWKVASDAIEWDSDTIRNFARHFYELGLNAQKGG